jgi:hypothetical protein
LTKLGYSKATRSKELAAIIDTLFCELYSVVDCTRTVIGAIYVGLTRLNVDNQHPHIEY